MRPPVCASVLDQWIQQPVMQVLQHSFHVCYWNRREHNPTRETGKRRSTRMSVLREQSAQETCHDLSRDHVSVGWNVKSRKWSG